MSPADVLRIDRIRRALTGTPAGPDRAQAARDFEALLRSLARASDDTRETATR